MLLGPNILNFSYRDNQAPRNDFSVDFISKSWGDGLPETTENVWQIFQFLFFFGGGGRGGATSPHSLAPRYRIMLTDFLPKSKKPQS